MFDWTILIIIILVLTQNKNRNLKLLIYVSLVYLRVGMWVCVWFFIWVIIGIMPIIAIFWVWFTKYRYKYQLLKYALHNKLMIRKNQCGKKTHKIKLKNISVKGGMLNNSSMELPLISQSYFWEIDASP